MEDLLQFLKTHHSHVKDEELQRIADNVRLVGAATDFATLHKVYRWMINGRNAIDKDGKPTTVNLIDFNQVDNPDCENTNIFRVVNQLTVDYINNGVTKNVSPFTLEAGLYICIPMLKK